MKNRRDYRKSASPCMLVALILAAVMTSAVKADELIDYRPVDPGTRLMSLFLDEGYVHDPANPASRLQLSFAPTAVSSAASRAVSSSIKPSRVLLTWHVRW